VQWAMTCESCRARRVDQRTRDPGQEAADRRGGTFAHDRLVQVGAGPVGLRPVRSGQRQRGDLLPAGTSIRSASRAVNSVSSAAMASHWSAIWAR
jgi:hypothetical protein